MAGPPEAAAVADELRLLDFIDQNPPQKPRERIEAALRSPSSLLLEDLLDSPVGSIPGLPPEKNSPAGDELNGEEELEWLSNKDAFPSLETSFEITDAGPVPALPKSFKVPVKARSNIRRKKRRIFPPVRLAAALAAPQAKEGRRCRHCEAEATPQWRVGPEGPKTLCNACGVRFKKGRLFPEYRPANSPTFSAAVHSNSTRGIMEMRMGSQRPGSRGRRRRPMATL